jgi:hypothetical protein
MTRAIDVVILTFCRKLELFYGTELIFRTLRVGFPNATVTVVDNASLPEVRGEIERLARAHDCRFRQIPGPASLPHHQFIERTIADAGASGPRPLVFLDPDLCLWASCEEFEFDALMAGKLIDAHEDDMYECVTMPRLHTSFLWIPDPAQLQAEIDRIRTRHFDFHPFLSFSTKLGDAWIRYDTGASLYAAISGRVASFTARHLDRYDHLFGGSHLDLLDPHYSDEMRGMVRRIHRLAKEGDLAPLRGIWRQQEAIWTARYGTPSWRRRAE